MKACLRLILYGSHLKCVSVKAIVYAGFQWIPKSKSTLDGFRKILYFPSNLLKRSKMSASSDFEMWTTQIEEI